MWDINKVRIIDIAEELKVSTATVSNVLHGKTKKISDETVKLVEKKLEERGYIPNMAATLLARNNSRIIGVVVNNHKKYEGHTFEDPFISAALNCLSDEIEENNYFMLVKKARDIMQVVNFSSMWNLDGMILIGFCADDYQNLRDHIRVPFVVYDGVMKSQDRICNVTIDDFDGGKQAGKYLRSKGHKKVLCIADNEICMDLDRYKGLCQGLESKAGFMKVPMQEDESHSFYEKNISSILSYSAVFAVSDYYAIDLISFLAEKQVRVPEDISVMGFDGSRDCKKIFPHLTTISQSNSLRAKVSLELLKKMLCQGDFTDSVKLPVSLVEGCSVKEI